MKKDYFKHKPEDFLISLFSCFPSEKSQFTASRESIQRTFQKLEKKSHIAPKPERLNEALNYLEKCGYISDLSLRYNMYSLSPLNDSYFSGKIAQKLSPAEQKAIKGLSKILLRESAKFWGNEQV